FVHHEPAEDPGRSRQEQGRGARPQPGDEARPQGVAGERVLSVVDDSVRAVHVTAEAAAAEPAEGTRLRIEPPPPGEPAPRQLGKKRKVGEAQPVLSTGVTRELRLRAQVAAVVSGVTVSALLREALRERLDRTVEERTADAVQRLAWNAAEDDDY